MSSKAVAQGNESLLVTLLPRMIPLACRLSLAVRSYVIIITNIIGLSHASMHMSPTGVPANAAGVPKVPADHYLRHLVVSDADEEDDVVVTLPRDAVLWRSVGLSAKKHTPEPPSTF